MSFQNDHHVINNSDFIYDLGCSTNLQGAVSSDQELRCRAQVIDHRSMFCTRQPLPSIEIKEVFACVD